MKLWMLMLIAVAVCVREARANGGTFATSSVEGTGHLVPQKKSRIALEREILKVELREESAGVHVEYLLSNRGGADTVAYGFPIDSIKGTVRESKGISGYRICDGDRELGVRKVIYEPAEDEMSGMTEIMYGSRTRDWYFSEIRFARGERKTLCVSYSASTYATISGTSKSFRWNRSKDTFRYSFGSAKTWGNGRVAILRIEVDVSQLRKKGIQIANISPAGATERDDLLVWDLKDVDFKKMPDLIIRYDLGPSLEEKEIGPKRLDRSLIESIRASSTLPPTAHNRYGVENLLDGRSDTAWIEGKDGPGIGEWIELTFKPGVRIKGIGILNGYTKSPQSLAENGCVRKIHTLCSPRMNGEAMNPESTDLQRVAASDARPNWPISALNWVFDAGDRTEELKKVRFTIRDAVPGEKFADTAISEIFIYGWKKQRE